MKKKLINCGKCRGIGKVKAPHTISLEVKGKMFQMRKKGKSLREIAKALGFKHPQSIKNALEVYESHLVTRTI